MEPRIARLLPLDAVRGGIMVLMALDHAGLFIARKHASELWGVAPPDYDGVLEFLVRAAIIPVPTGFFLLMGAAMALYAGSRRALGWSEGRIVRHFAVRGLILILLQFVADNPAWALYDDTRIDTYDVSWPNDGGPAPWIDVGVLSCLGLTMMLGALLLRLPAALLAALGAVLVAGTHLLVPSGNHQDPVVSPLLRLLAVPGETGDLVVYYPVLPWLGAVLLGLACGQLLREDPARTFRRGLLVGVVLVAAFVPLRLAGGFGNFHAPDDGWIEVFNLTRYPPSLSFQLLAVGSILIALGLMARVGWSEPLVTYGRSPLLFYLAHVWLFALVGLMLEDGTSLPWMLPVWLAGVGALYLPCRAYGRFKRRRAAESLWRLL